MLTTNRLPLPLYSAAQVRQLDASLIASGIAGIELMQRAAAAAWQLLRQCWPQEDAVTVVAGGGNNAGDGYLLARLAHQADHAVRVLYIVPPDRLQGSAADAYRAAHEAGVKIEPFNAEDLAGVVVDALLGSGFQGNLRPQFTQAVAAINASGLPVLALDLPTGVHADTGCVTGAAVQADLTLTFIGLKLGLLTGAAPDYVGDLYFSDLEADQALVQQQASTALRLEAGSLPQLASRKRTAHKGNCGHVLVLGGERGFGGAALLSSEAALRSGAGRVTLGTRPEHVSASLSRLPEVMCLGLESTYQLPELCAQVDVVVVGPGLGQMPWGLSLLSVVAGSATAQVWDADALNLLADQCVCVPAGSVLTPHPGEAARLLGLTAAEVQADRPAAALALAKRYQSVVVLKGCGTLVACPNGRLRVCDQGHPVMAGAGLGDVLAGLIGALRAQGLDEFEAACLAVWLHACAGTRLAGLGRGLAASDLIPAIRQLLEEHSPCL